MKTLPITLLFCVSALSVTPVVEGAIVGQYDFNSSFGTNFTQVSGSGVVFTDNTGRGVMTGGSSVGEEETIYFWDGQSLTAGQSWVLSVNSTVSQDYVDLITDPSENNFASLGLIVVNNGNPSNNNITQLVWGDEDGDRGFDSNLDNSFQEFIRPLAETTQLRLSYDVGSKILAALETDGSVLRSVNVATTWGMSDTDTFSFGVIGNTEKPILTDQDYLWLDTLKLETVPEPSSVMLLGLGAMMLGMRRRR